MGCLCSTQEDSNDPDFLYVALYDYFSDATDVQNMCLNVTKGTKLEILDTKDADWWRARIYRSNEEGYIPYNYVARIRHLEAQPWYFKDTTRLEAINLLMDPANPLGTFLVRPSESSVGECALSVKILTNNTQTPTVNHYKIKTVKDNGVTYYYIGDGIKYPSINELILQYSKNRRLVYKLTFPCPKEEPIYSIGPEIGKNWEINRNDITLQTQLGSGQYGVVWQGLWRKRKRVAVKVLKPGSMSKKDFLVEACIMKTLHHRNLVTLYAICSKEEPIYIIQEFAVGGCLLDYLRRTRKQETFPQLQYIAAQVAAGMAYIESKKLIHRDLAARNVLLGENNVAKICDFGLARSVSCEYVSRRDNIKLPIKWMALESITQARYTIKSDVWSFGILMMEIFTYGEKPYRGQNIGSDDIEEYLSSGYRMPNPPEYEIPDELYNVMCSCWLEDPEKRPTFEYLSHYFHSETSNEPRYNENIKLHRKQK